MGNKREREECRRGRELFINEMHGTVSVPTITQPAGQGETETGPGEQYLHPRHSAKRPISFRLEPSTVQPSAGRSVPPQLFCGANTLTASSIDQHQDRLKPVQRDANSISIVNLSFLASEAQKNSTGLARTAAAASMTL